MHVVSAPPNMARASLPALLQRYIATLQLLQCVPRSPSPPSLTTRRILTHRYHAPLPRAVLAPLQRNPRAAPRPPRGPAIVLQSRRAHVPIGVIAARLKLLFRRRMGLVPRAEGKIGGSERG
jgi:hypothetical protein